jgi:CheY-specific phosphatase CheX
MTLPESGPDAVRFQKDEEVFVFLQKDLDGNLQVIGGSQGKFVISKDIRTAQKMVSAYTTLDEMKAQVVGYLRTNKAK